MSPENLFSLEPLGLMINNILTGQPPGVTLETTLEMNDGTTVNFTQIPEGWRNVPAPQIPGLSGITIKVRAVYLHVPRCISIFESSEGQVWRTLHYCMRKWCIFAANSEPYRTLRGELTPHLFNNNPCVSIYYRDTRMFANTFRVVYIFAKLDLLSFRRTQTWGH